MEMLAVGPYASGVKIERPGNQVPLQHILRCRRWCRMWAQAIDMVDRNFAEADQQEDGGDIDQFDPYDDVQFNPYVEEPWSQKLFRTALQTQGLEGMQLVTLSEERVSKECRDQALKIKQQVENMMLRGKFDDVTSAKEQKIRVPKSLPKLAREVSFCMASLYPYPEARVAAFYQGDVHF